MDVSSSSRQSIALDALVGAVAPNLDVEVVAISEEKLVPVARAGDWLEIENVDLLQRLNPTLDREKASMARAGKALMQPIVSAAGGLFGRSFIWPEPYSFSKEGGWVTISGLRAAQLSNVQGVLLGEAMTAARDNASRWPRRKPWPSGQRNKPESSVSR